MNDLEGELDEDALAADFWRRTRADELARYRAQQREMRPPGSWGPQGRNALLWLHYYSIVGFDDGVFAESRRAQALGCTKEQLLELFALAFINSGPRGMRAVSLACDDFLVDYQAVAPGMPVFPPGWSPDPAAFRSGLDFSDPELSPDELELLRQWYLRYLGELPPYVEFLGIHRPTLLKAYRNRWENSVRAGLPKQIVPYVTLHYEVIRGSAPSVREALLLARGFGLTKAQVMESLGWALVYGGPAAMGIVETAAGDVLRSWTDER